MTGLLEIGEFLLTASERRLEVISSNVANTTTPGFKSKLAFQDVFAERLDGAAGSSGGVSVSTNFEQGALQSTKQPLDLAISGPGFFKLRGEDRIYYSRAGQFQRAADGRVINDAGLALQTEGDGDLVLTGQDAEILGDGTVLEHGLPVARIAVFQSASERPLSAIGDTLFSASDGDMQAVSDPLVRQGMLEGANVQMASEMIAMTATMRQAEIGARVIQVYDSLIGQSISTFGRTAR